MADILVGVMDSLRNIRDRTMTQAGAVYSRTAARAAPPCLTAI